MPEVKLTKDSDRLICLMYKEYLQRRKAGVAKGKAKSLGSIDDICNTFLPKENHENILETCRELGRASMLRNRYASNIIYQSFLTDEAIIYMENRFKDGLKGVANFLSQFIP